MVNLGCGDIFHPSWGNYDLNPSSKDIKRIDLQRALPFASKSLAAIYSSHVFEHLPRGDVPRFLRECARVLRRGGIIRLVVPDLEGVVRDYLQCLEAASRGDPGAEERHEWMTVELLDQLVRRVSGGVMARWWRSQPLRAGDLICRRLGGEAQKWIERFAEEAKTGGKPLAWDEIYDSPEPTSQKQVEFLRRGEVHRWMYDRVSLARLLKETGFRDVQVCGADVSRIEGFVNFRLDTDEQGKVRKPDSLFIEAVI
jgi:SAM-dependent methyltransferase